MKGRHLVAIAAMLVLASGAAAGPRGVGGGFRYVPPPQPGIIGGGFVGFPVWGVEREIHVIEREIIREVPVVVEPPPPPPPPRKPYKIGASYDSLPTPCMKMIEGGASYYHCSGEWYRQVSFGNSPTYQAIARP